MGGYHVLGCSSIGLKVLTYWEVYVAGLEYLTIFMLPMIVVGVVVEKSEAAAGALGCLSMLFLPMLQVAALVVFVLTLSPIIFGFSDDAAWSFPWTVITSAPTAFFKLVGVLVVAAIILAFIPFLGQLQSLQTLILGGLALTFVLGLFEQIYPGLVSKRIDLIPGFWFVVGLLVIGGLMAWLGTMAAALLMVGFAQLSESEDLAQLFMFPLVAIFGFIPVFIYGAWLGAQVKAAL